MTGHTLMHFAQNKQSKGFFFTISVTGGQKHTEKLTHNHMKTGHYIT